MRLIRFVRSRISHLSKAHPNLTPSEPHCGGHRKRQGRGNVGQRCGLRSLVAKGLCFSATGVARRASKR